ncbi:MAG: hypothetical protein SFY80_15175, partial [Verrucomicrobiota bacterium]|nr:hypothetical protein [Verrucomicrobiota bacterium]
GAMAWMLGYGALGSGLGLMSGIQGVLTGTLTAYGASMSLAGALMAIGAVSGFVGGLVATGSFKGAAFGALSGAAAAGIGNAFQGSWAGKLGKFRELSRAMAHGISGGVISDVQGGKFGVGGAGDGSTLLVYDSVSAGKGDAYFSWDKGDDLTQWIDDHRALGFRIKVVGHSYGADTAATVVANGHYVDELVTVDPVGWSRPSYGDVAKYSGCWENYNAQGSGWTLNNIIAGFGGAWNSGPARFADYYSVVNKDHAAIWVILYPHL